MNPLAGLPNEPPDWWKRWRPLRWLGALVLLLLLTKLVSAYWPETPAATPTEAPVTSAAPEAADATAAAEAADAAPQPAATMPADPPAAPAAAAPSSATAPAAAPSAITGEAKPPAPFEIFEDEPITPEHVLEAYTARPPMAQRLLFFTPFRSYASVDSIYKALEKEHYEPQLISRHARVPNGVPPSDLDIMTVSHFRHLDQAGTLQLQFFNDRLYQLEFEPVDAAAYRAQFRREWPQLGHEKSGRSEVVSGALRIASSLDLSVSEVGRALQSRPFVLWQDLRLLNQRNDWDYQFAKLATR